MDCIQSIQKAIVYVPQYLRKVNALITELERCMKEENVLVKGIPAKFRLQYDR